MNYLKVFVLIFFSLLVGLTTTLRPALTGAEKQLAAKQQADASCPDTDTDCPCGEESNENEEDSEWGYEFESFTYHCLSLPIAGKALTRFMHLVLTPEHFVSISIPPPERP